MQRNIRVHVQSVCAILDLHIWPDWAVENISTSRSTLLPNARFIQVHTAFVVQKNWKPMENVTPGTRTSELVKTWISTDAPTFVG